MNKKRILAMIAIVLLVGIYVAAFIASFFKSDLAQVIFRAALGCTIIIPVFLYIIIMVARGVRPGSTRTVDALIFDMGGVLMECPWEEHADSMEMSDEARKVLREQIVTSRLWYEFDTDTRPYEDIVEEFVAIAPDYADEIRYFVHHVDDCVKPFWYTKDLLKALRRKGLKLYYLSNWSRESVTMFKETGKLDFIGLFDGGLWSHEVHLAKPDRAFFDKLKEKYSLEPGRCLFVDDKEENVEIAKSLGYAGMLFTDYPDMVERLASIGITL